MQGLALRYGHLSFQICRSDEHAGVASNSGMCQQSFGERPLQNLEFLVLLQLSTALAARTETVPGSKGTLHDGIAFPMATGVWRMQALALQCGRWALWAARWRPDSGCSSCAA